MNDKFSSVPVEANTLITFSHIGKLGVLDVLYQKWRWEGISAESLIFKTDDIEVVSHKNLEKMTRKSPLVDEDSEITIKKTDSGYTFVNFNFMI